MHSSASHIDSPRRVSTREKLLDSAVTLFSTCWYETVSVAEICRHARLSNGIFYRYYTEKEEIFRELLDRYLSIISEKLCDLPGRSVEARLSQFIAALVGQVVHNRGLVSVYREGQYRFPGYEKRLRDIYMDAISRVYGRPVTETEYLYAVSGVRFVAIRRLYNKAPIDQKLLQDAVMNGIFTAPLRSKERIFAVRPRALEAEEKTSQSRLIDAGIKLFGKRGYYNINVYDVAREAGFSVGTFYVYFPTKEAFLAEIVRLIGRRTRHFISQNLDVGLNRLEQELQGLHLFLLYFGKNREYYSIVREAEFVVNDEVKEYYNGFERGYLKDLAQTRARDPQKKRIIANALLGLSHYFGIDYFFSKTIKDERSAILQLGELLCRGIKR
jgi:AcrR family transcriptional regulator